MLSFFAAKGGVGCSVVAAATAVLASARTPTLLVDLSGDLASLLGLSDPEGGEPLGIADWLNAENPLPDSLRRIERRVTDSLALLPLGSGAFSPRPDQARLLARLLSADGRMVVVDVGLRAQVGVAILDASQRTALVTRSCYLALRAARRGPEPDDVVLVAEPGRALSAKDVAAAIGSPVGPIVRWDPSISRAVDAGLLVSRLPRPLRELEVLIPSLHPAA